MPDCANMVIAQTTEQGINQIALRCRTYLEEIVANRRGHLQ